VRGHEGAGIVVNVSQWISRIRIGEIRTLVLG
jgi:Zn-dependent alcohol dehydrogenase